MAQLRSCHWWKRWSKGGQQRDLQCFLCHRHVCFAPTRTGCQLLLWWRRECRPRVFGFPYGRSHPAEEIRLFCSCSKRLTDGGGLRGSAWQDGKQMGSLELEGRLGHATEQLAAVFCRRHSDGHRPRRELSTVTACLCPQLCRTRGIWERSPDGSRGKTNGEDFERGLPLFKIFEHVPLLLQDTGAL